MVIEANSLLPTCLFLEKARESRQATSLARATLNSHKLRNLIQKRIEDTLSEGGSRTVERMAAFARLRTVHDGKQLLVWLG